MVMNKENLQLTELYKRLSNKPKDIEPEEIDLVSKYVYRVYGMNKKSLSFKSQRVHQLITTPDVNLRMLVPSQSGILQHMR